MKGDFDTQLQHFRATHPVTRRTFAGARWDYIACGQGDETLLLLPGAPGIAEMAFQYILAFETRCRILAPSYPGAVATAEALVAGLDELLHAETGAPVHLVGASYSGFVAQYLLHHHQEHVATLMIGDTGIPRAQRAQINQRMLRLLSQLPRLGFHACLYLILSHILQGNTPAHRFWQRYFKAIVASLTWCEFANRVRVWIDMDRQEWLPGATTWSGPTLLIETANDPLFSAAERAALRARYPHAEIHTFYSKGHITALTHANEYTTLMLDFLARHNGRPNQ